MRSFTSSRGALIAGVAWAAGAAGCDLIMGLDGARSGSGVSPDATPGDAARAVRWGAPQAITISGATTPTDCNPIRDGNGAFSELLFSQPSGGTRRVFLSQIESSDPASWQLATELTLASGTGDAQSVPRAGDDGRWFFYATGVPDQLDIHVLTRDSQMASWSGDFAFGPPLSLPNSDDRPGTMVTLTDGDRVAVYHGPDGDIHHLAEYRRPPAAPTNAWAEVPGTMDGLNAAASLVNPHLLLDGLAIYYSAVRENGLYALYRATRLTTTSAFEAPELIDELSDPDVSSGDVWVSPDEQHLFYTREGVDRTGAPVDGCWFAEALP